MSERVNAILDADLPAAQQVTLMHIQRQAQGDLFVGTHGDIAEARGVSRSAVSQQVRALLDKGWLQKCGQALRFIPDPEASGDDSQGPTDGSPSSTDGSSEKGFPLGSLPFSPKKVHSTPFEPSLLTPSQVRVKSADADSPLWLRPSDLWDSISEPLPDDHPARWEYSSDDWRWIAADWALQRLEADDMLNSHYRKRMKDERRGKIASEWADEIRKLVDLDGYSRDDVRITLGWLFTTDNWWRRNRTIQSLGALRKKGDDGSTKFDKILQSALADYEQQKEQQADPQAIREGFSDDEERHAQAAGAGGDSLPREPEVESGDFVW